MTLCRPDNGPVSNSYVVTGHDPPVAPGEGGVGEPLPGLEAEQVISPLGAAVVHELDGLPPVAVPEQHRGLVTGGGKVEGARGAPAGGPVRKICGEYKRR
jgi:hypothetical protein